MLFLQKIETNLLFHFAKGKMNKSKNDILPRDAIKPIELSDPMYDTIDGMIRKSYTDACICWIEHVENPVLRERYEIYKASLKEPNEKLLFHGTSRDIARTITIEGFRPEKNVISAYGNGVYFSTLASYSQHYSVMKDYGRKKKNIAHPELDDVRYLLICSVALGKVRAGGTERNIPEGYNSFSGPDMFIVDKKEACIPIYLAAFYPGATVKK